MDPIIEMARERRRRLAEELAELDAFLSTYDKLRAQAASGPAGRSFGLEQALQSAFAGGLADAARAIESASSMSKKAQIELAAEQALLKKQPLQTGELLSILKSVGVQVGGADEIVNLSSYLSRCDKFIHRRKDGGWFLAKEGEKKEAPQTRGVVQTPPGSEDLA